MDNWLDDDDDEQPQSKVTPTPNVNAAAAAAQARRNTNLTNNDPFVEEPLDDDDHGLFSNDFR